MEHVKHLKISSGINILIGLWMIASPFIFGYTFASTAMWNSIIFGILIAIIAIIKVTNPASVTWLSWVNTIIGLWLILSAFIISFPYYDAQINNVIAGILVVIFGSFSAIESRRIAKAHISR